MKPGPALLAWRRGWPWLLLLPAAVGLAHDAWQWQQARAFNRSLSGQVAPAAGLAHSSPEQAFALAVQAGRAASAGEGAQPGQPGQPAQVALALALYLRAEADPRLAAAAHFNSGNLHLREALALQADGKLAQNPQPVELAKRHFRLALRAQPGLWPARYNLERALWLAPELEPDEPPEAPREKAERSATTMRASTLGLP
jgi:mxaK protein